MKRPAFIVQLEQDQSSGASQLTLEALRGLDDYLASGPDPSVDQLNELADTLAEARPSMVPLGNAIRRWLAAIDLTLTGDELRRQARGATQAIYLDLSQAGRNTARHAVDLVSPGTVIMTHSRSGTVMQLFRALVDRQRPFSVVCTLSGPGNEGRQVAAELADLGVPVTLITDAEMGLFMPHVDLNLTGCDCWLADHHFLNKTGTYLQALAARDLGKPFWVLADGFRDSPLTRASVTLEEMDPAELAPIDNRNIRIHNVYFEPIPAALISGRVTENGLEPNAAAVTGANRTTR
ncbi:initiation factor 2B [Marinobacter halodurans]|uniref:Initiation factor 2B n=1 Tax=Marinobacter halodurans TaxID=2528979 RepID=A0ABY1ZGJ4_9GAMM|nr:initiation factor 2B [Marinobacter halodurans]TBW51251.1 initiation factor 2B [Marinobacter halodurans]